MCARFLLGARKVLQPSMLQLRHRTCARGTFYHNSFCAFRDSCPPGCGGCSLSPVVCSNCVMMFLHYYQFLTLLGSSGGTAAIQRYQRPLPVFDKLEFVSGCLSRMGKFRVPGAWAKSMPIVVLGTALRGDALMPGIIGTSLFR